MRDPYERVMQFNQGRDPQFLLYKYKLMASSAFRFFRGSCHLFYEDLAQQQTWKDNAITWICGDLHVENFGTYRSRHLVVYFDLNDFDEAVLAHPTWEVARFICSIFLAGQELNLKDSDLKPIAAQLLEDYLDALKLGKAFAIEKETVDGILKKYIKEVSDRDPVAFIDAHTVLDKANNVRQLLIDQKKYFELNDKSLKSALLKALSAHLNPKKVTENTGFDVLDVAIRVAGTGSIGLKRYVFLVWDRENQKHILFDMKQAQASSLNISPFLKIEQPNWQDQAERIQVIQTMMEYEIPAWLSHFSFQDQPFIVKILQPEQDKMDFKQCIDKPKKFTEACHHMARLMAYAQVRSTGRKGSDNADQLTNFALQSENWKEQLLDYSYNYAIQVQKDFQSFCQSLAAQHPSKNKS